MNPGRDIRDCPGRLQVFNRTACIIQIDNVTEWFRLEKYWGESMRSASFVKEKYQTISSIQSFMMGGAAPKYPANLFLEVSNLCDLKCAMCGPFSALNDTRLFSLKEEDRGFMKMPEEHKLAEVLKHALRIQVFGYGEPTLNPDFHDFLDVAGKYEALISFFSNGMHFSDEIVEKVIDNNVYEITISFSGATKEEYESVYMGGVWEVVLEGLKRIKKRKQERGSKYPLISVNSLAYLHHIAKFDRFVEVMADAGVGLIYLKPLVPVPTVAELGQHASIFRHWVDGEVLSRAAARASDLEVQLSMDLYTSSGASDEADYQKKLTQFYRNSGLDPDNLPPVTPITELRDLAKNVKLKKPPQGLGPVTSEDQHDVNASELNATGMYCFEPFNTMYVGRNLSVKPCCNAPSTTKFDSIRASSALDVWGGPAYQTTRKTIINDKYPSFCRECVRTGNAYSENDFIRTISTYGTWYTSVFQSDFVCGLLPNAAWLKGNAAIVKRQRRSVWKTIMRILATIRGKQ